MARHILLFDGTWMDPSRGSNVHVLWDMLEQSHEQRVWYDPGIGTTGFWEKYLGGLTGYGLSENVFQGYSQLVGLYNPGDEIFLVGYSRGAYTARALASMISQHGIVRNASDAGIVFERFLKRQDEPRPFLDSYLGVRVKFVGAFETVGKLGFPSVLSFLNGLLGIRGFRNLEAPEAIDNACHAMSLDERRPDLPLQPWTGCQSHKTKVVQRWFPGAHGDVGGGSATDDMCDVPLLWMARKMHEAGALFKKQVLEDLRYDVSRVRAQDRIRHDGYDAFLCGLYKYFKLGLVTPRRPGTVFGEELDGSVYDLLASGTYKTHSWGLEEYIKGEPAPPLPRPRFQMHPMAWGVCSSYDSYL